MDWTPADGFKDEKAKVWDLRDDFMEKVNKLLKARCTIMGGTWTDLAMLRGDLSVQEARKSGLIGKSADESTLMQVDLKATVGEQIRMAKFVWQFLKEGTAVRGRVAGKGQKSSGSSLDRFCPSNDNEAGSVSEGKIAFSDVDAAFRIVFARARFKLAKDEAATMAAKQAANLK